MTFQIKAAGVDVEAIMREIRDRIEEKRRRGLLTDAEVREIADHRLEGVLDPHDFRPDLLAEFRDHPERWNFSFDPATPYRSSRGAAGWLSLVSITSPLGRNRRAATVFAGA